MFKNILSNFGHNLINPQILDIASIKQGLFMCSNYLSTFYIKSRYCISSNMLTFLTGHYLFLYNHDSFVPHMSFYLNSLLEHGNHISSTKMSLAKKRYLLAFPAANKDTSKKLNNICCFNNCHTSISNHSINVKKIQINYY